MRGALVGLGCAAIVVAFVANADARARPRERARTATAKASRTPPPTETRTATATAVPTRWSTPERLSGEGLSWFGDIVSDVAGHVYAMWSIDVPGVDAVIGCRVDDGVCVREVFATRSTAEGAYVTRPVAAVDGRGSMHLLWRAKYEIVSQRLFLPDAADGWSTPPQRVGNGTSFTLAIAPDDTLHMAYNLPIFGAGHEECLGCGDIVYRRSTDGGETWGPGVNLSNTVDGSDKPEFAFGPDGEIVLVWEEGFDFYAGRGTHFAIAVAVSRDGGVSWEPTQQFVDASDAPHSPAVGFAEDGALLLVFRQSQSLAFRRSLDRGRTWSEPETIPGVLSRFNAPDKLDNLAMTDDAAGHLHLLATGRTAPDSQINALYALEWDGSSWSAPVEIFRTMGAAEAPRIAVREGNELHALWFERPEGGVWTQQDQTYVIWHSTARTDAPRVEPVVWPKPQPRSRFNTRAVSLALQTVAALVVVAGTIVWSRRRGL